ncbi:hypothetical protein [Herbidospora sp. RD11066]
MAAIEVSNNSTGWLVLWLEPLAEDRWLKPGETFRVRNDYQGDEPAFEVSVPKPDEDRAAGIQEVIVWVNHGDIYAEVTDREGDVIECAHQRVSEIYDTWFPNYEEHAREWAERHAGCQCQTTPKRS